MIESDPDFEVVGAAQNGQIALDRFEEFAPEAVTLDIEMPVMDGLETLEKIREKAPRLPVIMFSTLTDRGTRETMRALFLGATDYVTKPTGLGAGTEGFEGVRDELVAKLRAACRLDRRIATPEPTAEPAQKRAPLARERTPLADIPRAPASTGRIEILGIGISTGGPAALSHLIEALPGDLPVPTVIVQHMPPRFTAMLAEQLNRKTTLEVREAQEGDRLQPGGIWIAPGNFHMDVRMKGADATLRVFDGPKENSCRPAVDVLFRSLAEGYGPSCLALVMTGMGQDGLKGAEEIRRARGEIWAQDEASSVVWGMPGEIARAGLAHEVLPLDSLGHRVGARVSLGHRERPTARESRPNPEVRS